MSRLWTADEWEAICASDPPIEWRARHHEMLTVESCWGNEEAGAKPHKIPAHSPRFRVRREVQRGREIETHSMPVGPVAHYRLITRRALSFIDAMTRAD